MARPRAPARPHPIAEPSDYRQRVLQWIDAIAAKHGMSLEKIAKKSGISASTLYRWRDLDVPFDPSIKVLRKIAKAFDEPLPLGDGAEAPQIRGEIEQIANVDLAHTSPNQTWWIVRTRALELSGILPGAEIVLDTTIAPQPGDTVCIDDTGFLKLRSFEAPAYLITKTMDREAEESPIFFHQKHIRLIGTVVLITYRRQA